VRLSTGELSGFEALCRWRHPRRGLLPPDEFLPLAEEMGLMEELGERMLRASARQLADWQAAHPPAWQLSVSVNLSTGEIHRPDLVSDVTGLIAKYRLREGALKLEITESDIMRDPDGAAVVLRALRAGGAGLALDDFGTGYSSLTYLQRFQYDSLKIDRSFVSTMVERGESSAIVQALVSLGHTLGMNVVAEGVETPAQLGKLCELGCDYAQGFLLSRPLAADAVANWMREFDFSAVRHIKPAAVAPAARVNAG
jgi:c-di-GMP-specific phosphodiesterase